MPSSPFPLLAIDASGRICSALLLGREGVLGMAERSGQTGEAAFLPGMVSDLLAEARLQPANLGAVAVNVGPGSFTGLRASIAFASGLATGASLPLIPVTTAEALACALPDPPPSVWCALDARQGRIFLHQGGAPGDWAVALLADPPHPPGPVALTGDGAAALATALGLPETSVTGAQLPHAEGVGRAGLARAAGRLGTLAAQPLYIDPPRALLPRGGLRPPPAIAPSTAS
jgi:tRNA threonylcarbamoyladenosine biosynthesis protein TsaB